LQLPEIFGRPPAANLSQTAESAKPRRFSEPLPTETVLPTVEKLELLLRDVDAKGFLDSELVWKLRQKEGLRNVRGTIVRKIQQKEDSYSFEESVLSVLAE
jgi:hypothetical protein